MTAGIRIAHVSHRYGATVALDDVSFTVEPGRFCALLGKNGAGKSTLVSLLSGLFSVRRGTIEIAGHDTAIAPRKALAAMGIVFQSQTLDADLSVRQNMLYYAALHGRSGNPAMIAIEAALDRLGMRERMAEKVRALNGGHRRRMEIARALIHDPAVLLLDEPTAGLDMTMRRSITDHVHDLAREGGLSVLWTTHLADEIEPGDDLAILHKGRLVAHDRAASLAGDGSIAALFARLTADTEEAA